ncbi:MAG: UDP-glycosyltransferase [Bacteroidetes bacterium]|nr:UDP-glycosyltransferase [Bacteroidota bacterium]MDA0859705.1 UDP-glycosyltransferase [Bacteroidota bacterium]MDA1317709.1 UDP-glycosyltransferase [Bacteroidota bacterium]
MKIKNILIANHQLKFVGGSETFTYTLIEALKNKGYSVEYFTFFKGITSDKIEKNLSVNFMSKKRYDLILANHYTCVRYLSRKGPIIQTCHGIFPKLEKPSPYADGFVSISEEIKSHIFKKGFKSVLILNGINCTRYNIKTSINRELKNVLSLSQSTVANAKIESVCKEIGVNFKKLNKHINPIWNVEDLINEADLVVGLGRSAYEAMACGRPVVIYDERDYNSSKADGYMTTDLISKCVANNCSGRYFNYKFSKTDLIESFQSYNPADGDSMRNYALTYFNIDKTIEQYLEYAKTLKKRNSKWRLTIVYLYQSYRIYRQRKRES